MNTAAAEAPILVVGGRTTGLMMAAELARHGAAVRILDQSPGVDPHCRATVLHSRTLEILHGLGLAQEIVAKGQPVHALNLYANREFVGSSPMDAVDSPFPYGVAISQAKTEAMLLRHLNGLGVMVERNTQLTALAQDEQRVRATLLHADGRKELVDTPWLIGCDGAHSTVRHQTAETFPGEADPHPYLLADVIADGPLALDAAHIFLHDQGDLFFFPLDEGRRLVVASAPPASNRDEAPTLEQIQEIVVQRGSSDVLLRDPRWLTCFHIHYRLAPHYRHGRTFLAGDAAHVHSPFGGHGMNMGMQDAHNLAWKLALVAKNTAPERWLGSYEIERRAVARDVIAATRLVTENSELYSSLSPPERERIIAHMFVPESERAQARRQDEELDLDYRSSPLCVESDAAAAGPRAGSRALDAAPIVTAGGPCSFYDLLTGPHHLLLFFSGTTDRAPAVELAAAARRAVEHHGHWIDVCLVDASASSQTLSRDVTRIDDPAGVLHERYGAHSPCLYLIRPDGYVAYRSRRWDSLNEYLRRVL